MSSTSGTARQVEESTAFDIAVRAGLACYGAVHLMLGWLALQLALGDHSGAASQTGAMRQFADESYGGPLLVVIGVGFYALALWQAMSALWGHRRESGAARVGKRLVSAARAILYVVLGTTAVGLATGSSSSGGSHVDHYTAEVMRWPAGPLIVGVVGLAIVGAGVALAVKGLRTAFTDDLETTAVNGPAGTAVVWLGRVGYVAKGAAFGLVGALFVWAAASFDPDKAGGLDVALRTLLAQPGGPLILALIAFGLGAYGLYSLARARYGDTSA